VAVFDPHVEWAGGRAAADLFAAGPGLSHQLFGWRDRAVDFWFPPIRLPVGFGQTRTATQLPMLTMITGW
jgi:hypothetical protein